MEETASRYSSKSNFKKLNNFEFVGPSKLLVIIGKAELQLKKLSKISVSIDLDKETVEM